MFLKKRKLISVIFLVIIINVLIYIKNKEKTSFRYLIWNFQEISLGKIISISFISGLLISTTLNNSLNIKFINNDKEDENYDEEGEDITNEDNNDLDLDMPPVRDIRDAQPTISVNYRVVNNDEDNKFKYDENSSKRSKYEDDWSERNNEW